MKNFLSFLILSVILCGCVSFDYVGQRLPEKEDGEYITIYPSMQEVPPELNVLGRGKIIAPGGYDMDKLDALLTEKAMEVGAEAVAIASQKRVVIGVDNNIKSSLNRPGGDWVFDSRSTDGTQIYTDSFGKQQGLKNVKTERYRVYYQVVFLTKEDLSSKKAPVLSD